MSGKGDDDVEKGESGDVNFEDLVDISKFDKPLDVPPEKMGDDENIEDAEDIEDTDDNTPEESKDKKGKKDEEEPAKKEKIAEKVVDPEIAALKTELAKMKENNGNLNKAIHELRQEKKEDKKKEANPISTAELKILMKKAREEDDDETILQIVQYAAEQAAKKGKDDAISTTEIKSKKDIYEKRLKATFPSLDTDESTVAEMEKYSTEYMIEDHPYKKVLATGLGLLHNWKILLEEAYKKGAMSKKESKNKDVDVDEEEDLDEADKKDEKPKPKKKRELPLPSSTGEKLKLTVTGDQKDTMKRLGLTSPEAQKIYLSMLGKKKGDK